VKGFGRRPIATVGQALGPSSESPQGRNPRASPPVGHHLASATPIRSSCSKRALALAPGSVAAQNTLAIALASRTLDHMTDTPAADLARAKELAERPSVASPRNALAHYVRGTVLRALAPSHSCRQRSADSWRSGLP
jgi:hypothetical protein